MTASSNSRFEVWEFSDREDRSPIAGALFGELHVPSTNFELIDCDIAPLAPLAQDFNLVMKASPEFLSL
jgi:hypothetical protein